MPDPSGRFSVTSRTKTLRCDVFCVSTTGAAPETVIVSATFPTARSAFTVAVNPVVSSTPSRRRLLNPASVNVTE